MAKGLTDRFASAFESMKAEDTFDIVLMLTNV